ncbi:hypothetical protein DV532_11320 [Pseudomonas sp. Leaf58]|uniref:hypothetical protein n=1 Tax=Pseudomonas sp. Leaf58 TaxID=1736226 RepID=UPI0006FB06F2|nr:hypothetical protein [Pseudomonas sp. Leaf58]AYG44849.1 hypothetical protein DV532_11320 [Pseudomonas sp. Leaf58]KQN61524.1 hypothetical protein ASF02_14225 [Pseudomonas sp. Leaf58]
MLLDQEVWQAYEVAAEDTLRRFAVSPVPLGPPRPLPTWCATEGHDVIASFINTPVKPHAKNEEPSDLFSKASDMQPVITINDATGGLSIQGSLPLSDHHTITATELNLSYWPDKHDPTACARVIVKENNIRTSKGDTP